MPGHSPNGREPSSHSCLVRLDGDALVGDRVREPGFPRQVLVWISYVPNKSGSWPELLLRSSIYEETRMIIWLMSPLANKTAPESQTRPSRAQQAPQFEKP